MFFTKLGTIGAWLMLIAGALRLATGIFVGVNLDTPGFDPARYIGSRTPGHEIDRAALMILGAIILGIIAEVSRSLCNRASVDPKD